MIHLPNWLSTRIYSKTKPFLVTVVVVSFIVGSISGATFGFLGAALLGRGIPSITTTINPLPSRFRLTPPTPLPTSSGDGSIVDVVARSSPAVVSIVITKDVPTLRSQNPFFFGDPFGNDFFNNFFNVPQPEPQAPSTERRKVGGGTGFFVSADGLVLTNKHVVTDTEADYTVILSNGKEHKATILGRDPVNDLAVVKIEGSGFPTLPLGDSGSLKLGQSVIAIGNALGEFGNTVSTGVVSGLSRSVTASGSAAGPEELVGVIQTDAAINPGNSGGPLLNTAGEVVGINTAVAQGAQNIGFAIPVNEAKQVVESVKRNGKIVRPFLGVSHLTITPELAKEKSLPVDYGALIVRGDQRTDLAVVPGSPADKAGLVENDIILEVEGARVTVDNPLVKMIASHEVGDSITLKIYHRGDTKMVKVTLTERK